MVGHGQPVNAEQAIALAKAGSPLHLVVKTDVTQKLPIQNVLFGKDSSGKDLVVWVGRQLDRYVYLSDLSIQTPNAALAKAAEHGLKFTRVRYVALEYAPNGTQPVYWHINSEGASDVRIDAKTGDLVD